MLSLAYKRLPANMTSSQARALARGEAEQDLTLAGLGVFHTPLKTESEPALKQLADSSHQLVMITGTYGRCAQGILAGLGGKWKCEHQGLGPVSRRGGVWRAPVAGCVGGYEKMLGSGVEGVWEGVY